MHIGYHLLVCLHIIADHNPGTDITTDQAHATIPQIGTDAVDPDPNHIIKGTGAKVTITPKEYTLGHIIERARYVIGVFHAESIPTLIHTTLATTPHIKDPPLIKAHQPIHEITADQTLNQSTGQLRKPHIRVHPIPEDPMEITYNTRNPRVTIDDPPTDFYSSDDNSSNSDEESEHLN